MLLSSTRELNSKRRFFVCFAYHFEQEVELLRQEKLDIDQQIRAIQGTSSMNSMQNFTVQRRSDRGYSSDVDTMRPNRGSGAGASHQGNASNTSGTGMRGRGRGRANNTRYHPGNNLHTNIESTSYSNSSAPIIPHSKLNNSQSGNRNRRTASFNHDEQYTNSNSNSNSHET